MTTAPTATSPQRNEGLVVLVAWASRLAVFLLVAMLLYLAARPLDTNDMWWHLSLGEVYATQGPWPDGDPILFTAHDHAPVQQEWGFSVWTHLVERAGGFTGLRVFHGFAVAVICAALFALYRRTRRRIGAIDPGHVSMWAGTALAATIVLSWWRLFQLRSDLFSIPATLLLYFLLFEPAIRPADDRPGSTNSLPGRNVVFAIALFLLWSNMHALFGIGLALVIAALCGALLDGVLRIVRPVRMDGDRTLPRSPLPVFPWLAVLVGGALASAVNPRGFAQLATFFTVSRDFAIWRVQDDWMPFHPLDPSAHTGDSMSFAAWLTADILLVAFAVCAVFALRRYWQTRTIADLDRFQPVLFGLALAGCVGFLVSIRFVWLLFLPMLYLLRWHAVRPSSTAERGAAAMVAPALTLALALVFPYQGGFTRDAADPARYLSRDYSGRGFVAESTRFLHETGATGRLFNSYTTGGFVGYWLAPDLRLFIDSRTEHYDAEIVREYSGINRMRSTRKGETFLAALDRWDVDFFIGSGLPTHHDGEDWQAYTTLHVEGAPGWITVFRSHDQAVSLRLLPRNRPNLERIAEWYADQGVPFDIELGFDASDVVRQRPDWAIAHGLIPLEMPTWLAPVGAEDEALHVAHLNKTGLALALVGAHESERAVDLALLELRPQAQPPRRRIIHALLREGRSKEALAWIHALRADTAGDAAATATAFLDHAEAAATLALSGSPPAPTPAAAAAIEAARYQLWNREMAQLEVLTPEEVSTLVRARYAEPLPVR